MLVTLDTVSGVVAYLVLRYGARVQVTLPLNAREWLWMNLSAVFGTLNQVLFVWALKLG